MSFSGMNCDCCLKPIKGENFYVLTTSEVVYSKAYWKMALEVQETQLGRPRTVKEFFPGEGRWPKPSHLIS
jgi:hypothetical protein